MDKSCNRTRCEPLRVDCRVRQSCQLQCLADTGVCATATGLLWRAFICNAKAKASRQRRRSRVPDFRVTPGYKWFQCTLFFSLFQFHLADTHTRSTMVDNGTKFTAMSSHALLEASVENTLHTHWYNRNMTAISQFLSLQSAHRAIREASVYKGDQVQTEERAETVVGNKAVRQLTATSKGEKKPGGKSFKKRHIDLFFVDHN